MSWAYDVKEDTPTSLLSEDGLHEPKFHFKKQCEAVVRRVIKQKAWDRSSAVDAVSMGRRQFSSFATGTVTHIHRGSLNTQHGSCSLVMRDSEINKPVGDWPKDWVDGIHEEEGGVDHCGGRPQQ